MNILITAGGTREDIDSVRGITNYSTGRLGSLIADCFLENNCNVTYICAEGAILPSFPKSSSEKHFTKIQIRSTAQLLEKIEQVLSETSFHAVIHSMAVSDFAPHAVMQFGIEGHEGLHGFKPISEINEKISSDAPYFVMVMKQLPKVIARIKAIQPETLLVGFKLLSGVGEEELVQAGLKILEKNLCEYVLANDLQNIQADNHAALLLNKNGIHSRLNTKNEIADKIFNVVKEWYE